MAASKIKRILLSLALALAAGAVNAAGTDDDLFLSLREAARRDDADRAASLAARLAQYPVPSYVEYFRLKTRLRNATEDEIRDYLARNEGSAIGDRLRNDWLLWLGSIRDWTNFDQQYPLFQLNDDQQLKCYALMSRLDKGENVAAPARALLNNPNGYGEACPALVNALVQAGQFNADDAWAQMRLAAENNNSTLARRLAPAVNLPEKQVAQAMERPALLAAAGVSASRASHELFIIAVGRVAKSNVEQAAQMLQRAAPRLSASEQALAWAQVGMQASYKAAADADSYWRRSFDAPLSLDGYQWRARAALRAGDWAMLRKAIASMPKSLQEDAAWVYWKGRALKAEGRAPEAEALFKSIASQWNFYGQLATEELGMKISVPPQATQPTEDEIKAMAANPGFARAIRFFDLNMRFEGYREWNWQLRKMNDREFLAAAEYARRINLLDRMVNTSDRTRAEFDFTQRFPTPHADLMAKAVEPIKLDRAWVYGLIRQESRFVMNARSHVGASGLMQLMPATAKLVAKKMGMHDFEHSRVNDIATNLMLGTRYLWMVLNDMDGSQALATAGYNAGPGRPRLWRSTLNRSVEGAVFAETIPFTETRNYVKNVLSNATYYAALFENKPQSLRERLGTVAPKGYTPSSIVEVSSPVEIGSAPGQTAPAAAPAVAPAAAPAVAPAAAPAVAPVAAPAVAPAAAAPAAAEPAAVPPTAPAAAPQSAPHSAPAK